jgi:cobalt-zinc-cadmium efflux system protein
MGDAQGSVGVIVGGLLMAITGWTWVDPVVGAAIGLFIVPRAWQLGRDALRVLVQAAPAGLDPGSVQAALADVSGVAGVHDLHVWTLTSDMDVVTAHLAITPATDGQRVLTDAQRVLASRFGLTHATLQIETSDPCDHPDW